MDTGPVRGAIPDRANWWQWRSGQNGASSSL
jgi:hypothetical protein